ncbi:DUF4189 domain-containing protein [Nocardia asteroides]|uniref:DUF4189 domain-containing protein n=1 Tax=Nocardia asteroides NBRC 15531 TaxID=1110697 RepID=U5E4H6_NOCAS|nr:DUF4189 domain-containing protein [Nocardia asteroides]TLF64262.1 DUF4189 domain-containing protein [Nocardia asteroides NBRC 15531]UGT50633.1 DUF4189 domain-containing protein [Nocardia asteroides]SFN32230.1 protein of unknown function [Nocardia asteroides]VEG36544.1 Uncharacterised protein [Nocardia asteroides]GAD84187.1 hypothetical protein NCAST_21_01380 [Nocardia asteroides NBRC 15531]
MSFTGKAGVAVAALGLAAGSIFGAGTANAQSLHGAIAFSEENWTYESSFDWPSFEEAKDRALTRCGYDDCEVMVSWANGCGALVWNDQGWVAAASGPNRSEAVRKAIDKLSQGVPVAQLANFGSSDLSGTKVVEVVCTSNAN